MAIKNRKNIKSAPKPTYFTYLKKQKSDSIVLLGVGIISILLGLAWIALSALVYYINKALSVFKKKPIRKKLYAKHA